MEQRVHNEIIYRHRLCIVARDNRSREASAPPRASCARTLPRPGVVSPQSECQRQVDVAPQMPAAAPRWTQTRCGDVLLEMKSLLGKTLVEFWAALPPTGCASPLKNQKTYKNGVFCTEMLGSKSFIPLLEKDGKRLIFTIGRKK